MDFRTELNLPKVDFEIDFAKPIFTIGSCFSDVVGEFLEKSKFGVLSNPFGTVFNPVSIQKQIAFILEEKVLDVSKIIEEEGVFKHYDFHSSIYGISENDLFEKLEDVKLKAKGNLKNAQVVFITLGTSVIYELIDKKEVVANCHKQNSNLFRKRILNLEEIQSALKSIIDLIHSLNPAIRFVISVSPVRHIKDGLQQNSVSKSLLRIACDQCEYSNKSVSYFPAYELVLDDLRDYRFYKDDLIHPSTFAEKYVIEKFKKSYFSELTIKEIAKIEKVKLEFNHKLLNPTSEKSKLFLFNLKKQLLELNESHDFSKEIIDLETKIIKMDF